MTPTNTTSVTRSREILQASVPLVFTVIAAIFWFTITAVINLDLLRPGLVFIFAAGGISSIAFLIAKRDIFVDARFAPLITGFGLCGIAYFLWAFEAPEISTYSELISHFQPQIPYWFALMLSVVALLIWDSKSRKR